MLFNRILVIDDDEGVRTTICENLRECGFEVLGAGNGVEGLKLMDSCGLPDVVVTDIIMPEKDGLETIMEIRKQYDGVKVITISGGGRTEVGDFLEIAKKLGSDASFSKPIDIDKLEATIKTLVATR